VKVAVAVAAADVVAAVGVVAVEADGATISRASNINNFVRDEPWMPCANML